MRSKRHVIQTIDSHTGGEPTRLVISRNPRPRRNAAGAARLHP